MSTGAVPPSTHRVHAGRRRPLRTSVLALAASAVLLVPACGSGGDEESDATTTEAADQATTTTGDETNNTTDEPTTTAGSAGGDVSADDLESVMPEASDIGPGYRSNSDVEEGFDEPSDSDNAVTEACPEAAQFLEDTDEDDKVERLFETDEDRQIEIKLDPTPNANYDEDTIDTVIDAVNACDVIELDNNGVSMEMQLAAERDDTYGDRGVTMEMTAVMDHADFPAPITVRFSNRAFVVGSVSVSLGATDGITGDTAESVAVVPGDHDLLVDLAERLEADVAALQD